jgi:hypothetical protein
MPLRTKRQFAIVSTTKKKVLRRYTDLPALIYLLRTRSITLLDPKTWDDGNDAYYLRLYGQKKKLKSILAICFTQAAERYHHWRVFAGGAGGVYIRVKRPQLLEVIKGKMHVRAKSVRYLTLNRIRKIRLTTKELPF